MRTPDHRTPPYARPRNPNFNDVTALDRKLLEITTEDDIDLAYDLVDVAAHAGREKVSTVSMLWKK